MKLLYFESDELVNPTVKMVVDDDFNLEYAQGVVRDFVDESVSLEGNYQLSAQYPAADTPSTYWPFT